MNWIRFALFLLIALGLGQIITPTHPDSSYLRARYAQNLIDGEGFVYNPGDDTLLTSAPLMVIIHAATALPSGDITGPPVMLNLVVLAFGAFFLTQILLREKARIEIAFAVALIWLAGGFITFGGVETWLATFSLCTFYFADDRPRLAGFVAGLMLLIAPLALIFVLMLGATSERKFWLLAPLPALMWYTFAFFNFDLNSLALASAPGHGALIFVVVPLFVLAIAVRSFHPLVLWGLAYSLTAVVFHLTSDAMMLISAGVILAVVDLTPRPPLQAGEGEHSLRNILQSGFPSPLRGGIKGGVSIAAFATLILLAFISSDDDSPSVPQLDGSKGHIGSNQEAFLLGGTVIQLNGTRDPHLRELVDGGDPAGVIIATAPDYLLIDNLPEDPSLQLLGYRRSDSAFQRGAEVFAWNDAQSTQIDFGPDLRLTSMQQDRTQTNAGGIVRLRLDWEWLTNKRPDSRLLFVLQVLGDGVIGSVEQSFPLEKWQAERVTTYHVLPINDDALPGLYDIRLTIDLDAGIIDRRSVTQIKIPAPTDVAFELPPLAVFDDGVRVAELMDVNTVQSDSEIVVDLFWRAGSTFDADYTVFVHLTGEDDSSPVVQADSPPMNGRYPTSIWEPGEVIVDTHVLPMTNVPQGRYHIRVGLFHPERGRIPAGGFFDFLLIIGIEVD